MKGQELPINTIVLIVLVLVILVLALIFIVLPIARTPVPTSSPGNMTTFTFDCSTACGQPQTSANNNPANTEFCADTITYQGTVYHCYSTYGGKTIATCSYQAYNGTFYNDIGSVTCSK